MAKLFVFLCYAAAAFFATSSQAASVRLPYFNALIEHTDQEAVASDIFFIGCKQFPLAEGTKRNHCTFLKTDSAAAIGNINKALAEAHKDILTGSASASQSVLIKLAKEAGFLMHSPNNTQEILALYDFMVNQIIIKHTLAALRTLETSEDFSPNRLANFAKEAAKRSAHHVSAQFHKKLREIIKDALKQKEVAAEIVYASIGCGSARKDIESIKKLREDFPSNSINAYCLDPYQSPKGHAINDYGQLDTTPLKPGETLQERLSTIFNQDSVIILVGHYAFHHLGQSFDYFRHVSEGIPTILYESLVNDNWATTYQKRQRMLIFDILMNYGFDHLYDNNWVRAAAHENANYFQVHYINKNHLDDAVTITPIKGSNNSIVHY